MQLLREANSQLQEIKTHWRTNGHSYKNKVAITRNKDAFAYKWSQLYKSKVAITRNKRTGAYMPTYFRKKITL